MEKLVRGHGARTLRAAVGAQAASRPPRQQPPWGFLQRSVAFSALNLGPAGIVVIGNDRMKDTVLW